MSGRQKRGKQSTSTTTAPTSTTTTTTTTTTATTSTTIATTTTTTTTANSEDVLEPLRKSLGEKLTSLNSERSFWPTQPVLHGLLGKIEDNQAIEPNKKPEEIPQTPYELKNKDFEWVDTDVDNEETIKEIYTLLNENYVEDDDHMFRFDYSIPFLRWALKPPGWKKEWHLGVRYKTTGKLVGFITAIPATVSIYHKHVKVVEINFLCVHKKLRSKKLAPLLIREITRRAHVNGIFQAVYTAGIVLPTPVASCRYYHRSLNPKKLIDVGFSHPQPRLTMKGIIKLYSLPSEPEIPGIRTMRSEDVPQVTKLLTDFLSKKTENQSPCYGLTATFTEDECAHWLLPRDGVINSFVVENPKTHLITDLISFYTLPSSVLGNKKYKTLMAAYSYYNVHTSVPLVKLMNDALILAHNQGFDVFNALNICENDEFLKNLKFGIGDGHLQYYLYNWRCPIMEPRSIGLVLL